MSWETCFDMNCQRAPKAVRGLPHMHEVHDGRDEFRDRGLIDDMPSVEGEVVR